MKAFARIAGIFLIVIAPLRHHTWPLGVVMIILGAVLIVRFDDPDARKFSPPSILRDERPGARNDR